MILRLDPSDDAAEDKIRVALENRSTRNIHEAFQELLDTLYPEGYGEWQDPNIEGERVRREFQESQALEAALQRALMEGADLGVKVAIDQFNNIGFGFDWEMTHIQARGWAANYSGQLIRGVTDTTVKGVQQAVARFVETGEPLDALIADLQVFFGKDRARRVAVTETTRSYSEGTRQAYRDSRVVDEVQILTVRDDRVCPVCSPEDGKRYPLESGSPDLGHPPFHILCRCFEAAVVRSQD